MKLTQNSQKHSYLTLNNCNFTLKDITYPVFKKKHQL